MTDVSGIEFFWVMAYRLFLPSPLVSPLGGINNLPIFAIHSSTR